MANLNAVHKRWAERGAYSNGSFDYLTKFLLTLKDRGEFITMSDAVSGGYNKDKPCFVLDHHIDYYPLETMELLRWEADNGIISSTYLFNSYNTNLNKAQVSWEIEDLDIPLFQELEKEGFEFGYHVNAMGLAKIACGEIARYSKVVDEKIAEQAKIIFSRDVSNLRKYLSIKTAVPHGAGEGNNLIDLGYQENHIIPTYNARAIGCSAKLQWRNFSDSVGQYYSKFNGQYDGVVYMSTQDRFDAFTNFVNPRLYHILIHPGRYGEGITYGSHGYQNLHSFGDVTETDQAKRNVKINTSQGWIVSDDVEFLYEQLKTGAREKLCLVREEKFTKDIRSEYRVPRPVSNIVDEPMSVSEFAKQSYWSDTLFCPKGFVAFENKYGVDLFGGERLTKIH